MIFKQLFLLPLCMFFSLQSDAHPISYLGATSLISMNSAQMSKTSIHHTFTRYASFGGTYLKEMNSELMLLNLNFLVKRWNMQDSQANIYLSAGYGQERFQQFTRPTSEGAIALDWESRKLYTSYEYTTIQREMTDNPQWKDLKNHHHKLRLGFAPYLGEYHELNTWYIFQLTQHNNNTPISTQFLRFYIKNVLWEIGADSQGQMAFNFMVHY